MPGLEQRITVLLAEHNREGGFLTSLVCTDKGLLLAGSGATERHDDLAALASLFDDVVLRAGRDLGMEAVDELTIRDGKVGRFVIRPLPTVESERLFLVVHAPLANSWRRTTNRLCVHIERELLGLTSGDTRNTDDA